MELDKKILSDLTVHMKYARFLPEVERRETWNELIDRNMQMHIKKHPVLEEEIRVLYRDFVATKKVLPSMRSLQFGGKAIELNNSRIYNCAYLPIDSIYAFSETMFLLLGGTGVGYSVQNKHIEKLPEIKKPNPARHKRYVVSDDIMGWADAVKILFKAYTGKTTSTPIFDLSDIREKGALLITAGGKAPGPDPLRIALTKIEAILKTKSDGSRLSDIECHDIECHIADAVLAGGIRRAAMISLFDLDSSEMINCKSGAWWETNPQRGRANNSAVILRHKIDETEFMKLWERIEASGSGEPGMYLTNDNDWGTNPSLRAGTKVITSNGIFPIEELQDTEFEVKNLNGQLSKAKCWLSGKGQQLYKLTLKDGTEYFATKEHEWPVWDGEKYVKVTTPEIPVGSKLPFLRETKLFDGSLGNYNEGFLCGWLTGDGWITNRKSHSEYGMIVSDNDDEYKISSQLLETIHNAVPTFSGNFSQRYRRDFEDFEEEMTQVVTNTKTKEISINNIEVDTYLKSFGIRHKSNGLPLAVWKDGSEDFRKGVIDGLFSSDGHVTIDKKRITLTSAHKQLVEDVSELLGFYGVKSTIKQSVSVLQGKSFVRFDLRINENQSIKQFISVFNLSVGYKQDRLEAYMFKNTKVNNQVEVIGVEKTNLFEDVWDISVYDETHCFQLAKVVTGNCCEIALRPNQFCNLTEINMGDANTQEEFEARAKAAAFLGTLQASYSDFHYLRDIWRKNTEKDSLLGVSMTGIASESNLLLDYKKGAEVVKEENRRVAKILGINSAARTTAVKPAGTTSLVLGTSSGIHAWHNDYYIRRIRLGKNEAIYSYLAINHPELLEDEFFNPTAQSVVSVPQKAPKGAITRHENVLNLLERVKLISEDWVKSGHVKGENTHNVSCTVSVRDGEWANVGEWMWKNRSSYNGLSVLPMDGGTYKQTPFQDITEDVYYEMVRSLNEVDLSKVVEMKDETSFGESIACSGTSCDIV